MKPPTPSLSPPLELREPLLTWREVKRSVAFGIAGGLLLSVALFALEVVQ